MVDATEAQRMDEFSGIVNDLSYEYDEKYPDDAKKAIRLGLAKLLKMTDSEVMWRCSCLIAFTTAVHDRRHQRNTEIKKTRGEYGQPAKVPSILDRRAVGVAAKTLKVRSELFGLRIGGKTLGGLTGEELAVQYCRVLEASKTNLFQAALLKKLRKIVPDKKTVLSSVSNEQIEKFAEEAENEAADKIK